MKSLFLFAIGITLGVIAALSFKKSGPSPSTTGEIMFIVKDDNPDVGYQINPGIVTDAEGNPVDATAVTTTIESDNPDVVAVNSTSDTAGTVHFGKPGDAAITATISSGATVLAKLGAQFHVTSGDPAAITGGSISFDGLTEAPTTPARGTTPDPGTPPVAA
jgi:hypothetical protein